MDGNKDDAVKALRIGKDALDAGDTARALKFLSKAKRLDPLLPIDHLLNPLLNKDDPSSSPASSSSSSAPHPPPPPPSRTAATAAEPIGADGLRERKQKGKKKDGEEGGGDAAGLRTYTEEQLEVVHQIKKHTRDYYKILGLEKDCTVEDVRKAYRKLSLKVHPDKNKAPGAEDAFKAVSKAFQCLSDAESRKRFDLVGSEEPPAYNRRAASTARSYNGFYEDDIDPDEIFRNFFFGGMAPATTRQFGQFGTFHFRTGGMHHAHGAQQGSGGSTVRMLVQLLPVLLLLLLNFLPSSEPVYSLSRSYPYEHKFQTQRGVTYYVKLPNFEDQYPHQSTERTTLERHVERDYYSIITQNCRVELQRRQWGLAYQTPHCDMLQKFEATAQ
ncbi:Chaperone protein dnaJ 49 [Hordeum vulgare]|uniref:J domain-containing protein n=2 Tax=Hordeum vulgare subsp. vulgare TaxID=112509 RepID=M0WIN2_HORVV|nr:chaperone protein dnaJ 49 [Hordeum vulgare subsp. vulgare]KAE8821845.1 Chaperone protein dnaJ 49 [Hordeum vulgare]